MALIKSIYFALKSALEPISLEENRLWLSCFLCKEIGFNKAYFILNPASGKLASGTWNRFPQGRFHLTKYSGTCYCYKARSPQFDHCPPFDFIHLSRWMCYNNGVLASRPHISGLALLSSLFSLTEGLCTKR